MTNTLVPHEIAVELKSKGFSEPCTHYYDAEKLHDYGMRNSERYQDFNNRVGYEDCYSAPDIYQAAAWLRDDKGLHIFAFPAALVFGWDYRVMDVTTKKLLNVLAETFPDHDTAYISGIANGLKLVK